MEVAPENNTIVATLNGHRAEFDPAVPGVDAETVKQLLRPTGEVVHIGWSRCPTRAALLHVYDTLASAGLTSLHPSKADALLGWDEMHPASTALVTIEPAPTPPAAWGVSPSPDVLMLGDSFDELLDAESPQYVNHVGIICKTLQFPLAYFEEIHLHAASELFQRCTAESAQSVLPHVFVRSYRFKGVVAPLLVWYRVHEYQVTCMLQEFLHVRYPHIPNAVVWYWQLLPYHANVELVGKGFDDEEVLPSLRNLLRYAAVSRQPIRDVDAERLFARGQKDANQICTRYGQQRCALWLGTHVFFYVERDTHEPGNELTNVRIPSTYQELPPWVMHLLVEVSPGVDAFAIGLNVNSYLQGLHNIASRSTQLLRGINWASVPLVWKPMFMQGGDTSATAQQAADAQARLLKSVAPSWEEPEVLSEAIERLGRITGI